MEYTDVIEKALAFALEAHSGAKRKISLMPYILHPMEVGAIAASVTKDEEVIAAAILHDVVEDTTFTIEDVHSRFGKRIAALVASETENKREDLKPEATWRVRKEESLAALEVSDRDGKIIWLSDKLSNMRSIAREYAARGNEVWRHFHEHDPAMHCWYYTEIAKLTRELGDTLAWQEYTDLICKVFGDIK